MRKLLLFYALILLIHPVLSQSAQWSNLQTANSKGIVGLYGLEVVSDGYYLRLQPDTAVQFRNTVLKVNTGKNYLCKTDRSFNLLWSKELDSFSEMTTDPSGNVYVGGTMNVYTVIEDTMLLTTAYSDGYVVKYSSTGNREWIKRYNGYGDAIFYHFNTDEAGNLFITGSTSDMKSTTSIFNDQGVFILKYSGNGELLLLKEFKGPYSEFNILPKNDKIIIFGAYRDITIGGTRYQLPSGQTAREMLLASLNASGDPEWVKTFPTFGEVNFRLASGGTNSIYAFGLFGEKMNFTSEVSIDKTPLNDPGFFLVKFDDSGTPQWQKLIEPIDLQYFVDAGIAADAAGNVFLAGCYSEEIKIDNVSAISSNSPFQTNFIITFNSQGTQYKNLSFDALFSSLTAISEFQGKVYVGGNFAFSATFGTQTITQEDLTIYVGSPSLTIPTGTIEYYSEIKQAIYPNPTINDFFISGKNISKVELFTINGVYVSDYTITDLSERVKVTLHKRGLYIVKYESNDGLFTELISVVDDQQP